MKQLGILRHAKSSWDRPDLEDVDRPLNERGRKSARRVGHELENGQIHFDVVLASTAARVRETISGVQEEYDFAVPIRFEPRLYLADVPTILSLVRDLPDQAQSALLIGHNPGLQQFVLDLSARGDSLRLKVADKYPTAALALIELPVGKWSDVAPNIGDITTLILPKELD